MTVDIKSKHDDQYTDSYLYRERVYVILKIQYV